MNIIGINSFFEHPSVALVVDGELVFAIEDERLTRVKHGKAYSPYTSYLPYASIYAALKFCGLKASDITDVAYSYSGYRHIRASIFGALTNRRMKSFRQEVAAFRSLRNVRKELVENHTLPVRYHNLWRKGDFASARFREWDHHLSHAASAFYCSGFDRSLILVADGRGEGCCTSVYIGSGGSIKKILSIDLPNSLGFLYSNLTYHLGFQPFEDEYKVMGLAAYGRPEYLPQMGELIQLLPHGRYQINSAALANMVKLFGPARRAWEPIDARHEDIARSLQVALEGALSHVVSYYLRETGERNLAVAGGTFLNCVANAKLSMLPELDNFFVQPAAHDGGTAIGAAALSWVQAGGKPQLEYSSMLLGTEWNDDSIELALREANLPYRRFERPEMIEETARFLNDEYVVAFFQGRMEFGPRALGARSFLASPRSERTRERLNIIKAREQFRPLAPIVLEEHFDTYFTGRKNRYMMFALPATEATKRDAPAVVHADGTSRVQVIRERDDELLYKLLQSFASMSNIPILINTSLNIRGKPIDESPVDAIASAVCSGVDAMVLGQHIVDLRNWRGLSMPAI